MKNFFIFCGFLLWIAVSFFIFPSDALAGCPDEKPDHAPDLFQISTTKNSAILYFTPVNNAVSGYVIFYGYYPHDDRFGVSFPFGRYDGVINYTINHLAPNTKYYFRVRAVNGCRYGFWSKTMSARTINLNSKNYRVR